MKAYQNQPAIAGTDPKRNQHHGGGRPSVADLSPRLPGLGGDSFPKPKVPELPADTPNLFDSADVAGALEVWDKGRKANKSREAIMREIMMLSLAIAAVNLGVNPEAAG
jgi:hypothetical protein